MIAAPQGLVHLLGSDFRALCGSEFGLLSTSSARCTCGTCLAVWDRVRHDALDRSLVTDDDSGETGH